ncbi:MAG TPA: sugar-binding protein [Myxococcales bacterium]
MRTPSLSLCWVAAGLLSSTSATALATDYYADPSAASSTLAGTLANPWRTLAQVNAGTTALNPGDRVLFRRGQTYSGSLTVSKSGIAGAPITYSAYGAGDLPKFDNSISNIVTLSGKQYVVIDSINFTDSSIDVDDPLHQIQAKVSYCITLFDSPHCTVSNCEFSLVGVAIAVEAGSDYTTITGNYMHNGRMVRNTPTSVNPDDDYGANPMVIGSSNNTITRNRFEESWAKSYDYGFDGGAVELFAGAGGYTSNNLVMFNTAYHCNGFTEIGSSGGAGANDNVVAYNLIINSGEIATLQNSGTFGTPINNLQIFNNTIVQTPETLEQYLWTGPLLWQRSSPGPAGMVSFRNNLVWLTSGAYLIQSGKFDAASLLHSNNLFRTSNPALGVTLDATELSSSTLDLFVSASGAPSTWNYRPLAGSPAIDFGTHLGFSIDFAGNPIVGNPDVGIYEFVASGNQPPVVEAGADQTVRLPASPVTFSAVASDPDGTLASYAWTSLSGGAAALAGAATSDLTVSGFGAGSYLFRVLVTDDQGATASDTVSLTVEPAAGADAGGPGNDAAVPGSDAAVPGGDAAVAGVDAAVPTEPALACRAPGAVAVDGVAAEWDGAPSFRIPASRSLIGPDSPEAATSDTDCSAVVRCMWDDTSLYVLVEVSDDLLFGTSTTVWRNDGVELFFDGLHERAATYDSNDYQLMIDLGGEVDGTRSGSLVVQHALRLGTAGYAREYAISFASLGLTSPSAGALLGFDVALDDSDVAGSRTSYLAWRGQGDGWKDPRQFGELELSSTVCGRADAGSSPDVGTSEDSGGPADAGAPADSGSAASGDAGGAGDVGAPSDSSMTGDAGEPGGAVGTGCGCAAAGAPGAAVGGLVFLVALLGLGRRRLGSSLGGGVE